MTSPIHVQRVRGPAIRRLPIIAVCLLIVSAGARAQGGDWGWSGRANLRGHVSGGAEPLAGARIQLFAAGTHGYGRGAVPLLPWPVLSDEHGNFAIQQALPCPSSTSQVYLVATGGHAGGSMGWNAWEEADRHGRRVSLMTAVGPCVRRGEHYVASSGAEVTINEVTTVASVYALAGFMDGQTGEVGASRSNSAGIANSFQTVLNLVDIETGDALTTTPAGNGSAPQAEIDTLADMLASCITSTDDDGCAALFAAAAPSGGATPVNTRQAMFDIATNPISQVAALYALASASSPYQPILASAPNDWTVQVMYATPATAQAAMAIDADGDVWIANNEPSSVTELANNGANLSGSDGFTGGGIQDPGGIAIDPFGSAWVVDSWDTPPVTLTKLSSTGTPLSPANGFATPLTGYAAVYSSFGGLAIDGSGNVWCCLLSKFDNNGNLLLTVSGGGLGSTGGGLGNGGYGVFGEAPVYFSTDYISLDPLGNVWAASLNFEFVYGYRLFTLAQSSGMSRFSGDGTPLWSTSGSWQTDFLDGAASVASDHAGNIWVTSDYGSYLYSSGLFTTAPGGVYKFANDGTNLSGDYGFLDYTGSEFLLGNWNLAGIAIDGGGNVWVPCAATPGYLVELDNDGDALTGSHGLQLSSMPNQYPIGEGIDGSGNVWVLGSQNGVTEFVGAATPVVTPLSIGVRDGTVGTRP